MKGFVRLLVFYTLAIYFVGKFIPGFKVNTDLRGLIVSGFVLASLYSFVYPLIKFLFLPLNLLTLGLFSVVAQILTFYLFLKIFPHNFLIESWRFSGYSAMGLGLNIKPFTVNELFTIIASSSSISIIVSLLLLLI